VDIYDGRPQRRIEACRRLNFDNRVRACGLNLPRLGTDADQHPQTNKDSFDIHPPKNNPPALGILGTCLSHCCLIGVVDLSGPPLLLNARRSWQAYAVR